MEYCFGCDRDFPNKSALRQHLRDSQAHAPGFDCDNCARSFGSEDAFQRYLRDSPAHALSFDCDDCGRNFGSEDALQQHRSNSKAHNRERVDRRHITYRSPKPYKESTEIDKGTKYNGISPSLITPVYELAVRLRRKRPSVENIMSATGTSLETTIVTALINAAERLDSLSESREDAQRRAERQQQRSQQAQQAEDAFIEHFSRQGFDFVGEGQQRQRAVLLEQRAIQTPDMRFTSPVKICGLPCNWLEFNDYFGFPDHPFVSSSEKKQLKKYVLAFGPGAVVYSLGFQSNYPNIKDVSVFRAWEVLQSILSSSGI
ncbi:hypothetical protein LTR72_010985 [Exophiala xenobiotica]|nr:hypothetical protein LTR92_011127 [Exophiala xenobiotica]KAK5216011.1 hypothetical protein LTR72_010985 [Exophiala xenobiotica]KAK5284665.1 hypothetical protein LTR14_011585 [Exophiala xenobiotica]KAK5313391.1 hypothetical protein LTR93_010904 [Exophiala xenobiotica]KAK5470369.1 hypothetical protein LTR55_011001 [Exophiala xenobiotica]